MLMHKHFSIPVLTTREAVGKTGPSKHETSYGAPVPPHPREDPPGNRTVTIHACFQAQKLHCKIKEYSGRAVLPSRS